MVTIHKEQKGKKIIVRGLLLPKDKISRNGILYDWESVVDNHEKLVDLPMLYNHLNEGKEKPIGRYTDSTILLSRPDEGKWQEVWDDTAEKLKVPEGVPGWYYEVDINPNSEYTDSILRKDISKVSIQIMAGKQKTEKTPEGESYTRAFIKDILESSAVPTPGFMETTMAVMAEKNKLLKASIPIVSESFNVKESGVDELRIAAKKVYNKSYDSLGELQKSKLRSLLKNEPMLGVEGVKMEDDSIEKESSIKVGDKVHSPSGYGKVIDVKGKKVIVRSNDPAGDFEYDLSQVQKESLTESHMEVGDEIVVGGKKMKVVEVTDDGYKIGYAESQTTATNPGATAVKLDDEEKEEAYNVKTEDIKNLLESDSYFKKNYGTKIGKIIKQGKTFKVTLPKGGPNGTDYEYHIYYKSSTGELIDENGHSYGKLTESLKESLKDDTANKLFRKSYDKLSDKEKEIVEDYIADKVSKGRESANKINTLYERVVLKEAKKIACLDCDEVNTVSKWQKSGNQCPNCGSTKGVEESFSPLDKLHERVCKESKFKVGQNVKIAGNKDGFTIIRIDGNKAVVKRDSRDGGGERSVLLSQLEKESFSPLNKLYERVVLKDKKK